MNITYSATINDAKTVITINPSMNLGDGAVYVAISSAYYDSLGNQGMQADATFTVDTAGPVPTFSPADDTATKNNATNITLTFDEALRKDGSGTALADADLASLLTLKEDNSGGTDITYNATINSAKKIITINPASNLADGTVYVAISNAYYDAHGNQGDAANATFTVDTTGPVPTFDPADGATTSDNTTNITLKFDEAIKAASTGTDFTDSTIDGILTLKATSSSGSKHRLRRDHRQREEDRHDQPDLEPRRRRRVRGDLQRLLRRPRQPGRYGQRHLHGGHHGADGDPGAEPDLDLGERREQHGDGDPVGGGERAGDGDGVGEPGEPGGWRATSACRRRRR